jgi:hypothetical protein
MLVVGQITPNNANVGLANTGSLQVWGGAYISGNTTIGGQSTTQQVYVQGNSNLLTYSQNLENAAWFKSTSIVRFGPSANTYAPDGTNTASQLINTTGGVDTGYVDQYVTTANRNTPYTFSSYVKQGSCPFAQINMYVYDGTVNNAQANVNFSTGTFTTAGTNLINSTFTPVGGGWYRVSITLNTLVHTQIICRLYLRPPGVAGEFGYFWGAQLEPGITPSAYANTSSGNIVKANNNLFVMGNTFIYGGNTSISNTTGSLIVHGGLGVSGNVNVSNTLSIVTQSNGNVPFIMQPGVVGLFGARFGVVGEIIDFYTTGSPFYFSTNGVRSATQFVITNTGSSVNYLQIAGNTTGGGVVISGQGSDTNVDINIAPKGIGAVNVTATGTSTFLNVTNPTALAILNVTASASCTRSQIITFAPGNGSEANLLIYTTGSAGLPPATAKISSTTGKSTIQVEGGQSASMNIVTLGATSTATANLQIRSGIGGSFSGDAGILIYGKTNSLKLMHTGTGAGSRFDIGGDSPLSTAGDFARANITSSLTDGVSSLSVIGGNRADFKLSANGASGFTSFDVENIGTSNNIVYANVVSSFGGANVQILGQQVGLGSGSARLRIFSNATANLTIESGSTGLSPNASLRIVGAGSAPAYANIGSTTSAASQVNIISSLPSTSNTTGALVITGGLGVSGNIFVGGTSAGSTGVYTDILRYSANGQPWSFGGGGGGSIAITNDTTNSTTLFPLLSTANSGTLSTANTSNTKLYYTPSTGTLNATVFNSLSDVEYKENIITITNAVNTINQIDGVSFSWKENGLKSYGVIAQDIEKIMPELVSTAEGTKSVNYSGIIAFLINSVKELDARVKQLENK